MARLPPRRFVDRPDEFDFARRPEGPPRFSFGQPERLGRAFSDSLLQRDRFTIASPAVDFVHTSWNEVAVPNWKRANGALAAVHKGKLEASRGSSVMSAALANASGVSSQRDRWRRAKPTGADNRFWNPTSGPKTYYGTFASIVPNARGGFRFVLPRHVAPCVQRQTRKEVLFAKKRAGGSSSRSKKRFTPNSRIGC